jgi:hypothetical protein
MCLDAFEICTVDKTVLEDAEALLRDGIVVAPA